MIGLIFDASVQIHAQRDPPSQVSRPISFHSLKMAHTLHTHRYELLSRLVLDVVEVAVVAAASLRNEPVDAYPVGHLLESLAHRSGRVARRQGIPLKREAWAFAECNG